MLSEWLQVNVHGRLDQVVVIVELTAPEQRSWVKEFLEHVVLSLLGWIDLKWVVPHQNNCVFQKVDSFFQEDLGESVLSDV